MTSYLPPSCGYSFLIVWKQCGHDAMTLRIFESLMAVTFASAYV